MPGDGPVACAVVGMGTMGAQIALSLALGGHRVALWGRRAEAAGEARERMEAAAAFLVASQLSDPAAARAAIDRVEIVTDLRNAADGADFIIEALSEEIDLKRDMLAKVEALAAPDAILSSTTSALSPTAIQSALARPGLFCVAHYAQPAHLVSVVEVVPGRDTDPETTQAVTALLEASGKVPVLCPDVPGFLWARIQHAVLREFASLVGRGLVTPEACDTILRRGYASRLPAMGAFEHADLAGLDLMNGPAARAVWADLSNASSPDETPVGSLFREGHTGMRSGRGFYDWSTRDADAFKAERDAEIVRRVKLEAGGHVVGGEGASSEG